MAGGAGSEVIGHSLQYQLTRSVGLPVGNLIPSQGVPRFPTQSRFS